MNDDQTAAQRQGWDRDDDPDEEDASIAQEEKYNRHLRRRVRDPAYRAACRRRELSGFGPDRSVDDLPLRRFGRRQEERD
jgi:hypothetical protein